MRSYRVYIAQCSCQQAIISIYNAPNCVCKEMCYTSSHNGKLKKKCYYFCVSIFMTSWDRCQNTQISHTFCLHKLQLTL